MSMEDPIIAFHRSNTILLCMLMLAVGTIILYGCGSSERNFDAMSNPTIEPNKWRPIYHFTPEAKWMNDPNGMVYFEGEYHLFYQYYPDSTIWGPMHWGHAVSQDLVQWKHLPIALYPDSLGYIFSGSAVIDWNNTSGFGTSESPAMIAIYTYHDPKLEKQKSDLFQTQGIAYSLDKGRSWTKYENNPVLKNPGIRDFRDPKVIWHSPTQKWIMILAVSDRVHLYSSQDLKTWEFESEFGSGIGAHKGVWECPDLFELTTEEGQSHWVMLVSINPGGPQGGSATQYFVGNFDGKSFASLDTITRWVDYGADNYAGVTYSDIPDEDGRRIFIGWMSNWQYAQSVPTHSWRSAMTIPRSLSLKNSPTGYLLVSTPVAELDLLKAEKIPLRENKAVAGSSAYMLEIMALPKQPFQLTLSNDHDEKLVISCNKNEVSIDRTKAGLSYFDDRFAALHTAPLKGIQIKTLKVYVDESSVELFINDGEIALTELLFPTSALTQISYSGNVSSLQLSNIYPIIED